jgi:hypothetical protein
MDGEQLKMVQIAWRANPFRGDKFEEAWLPAAEAVMKFGARGWAFMRSDDDGLHFEQYAWFENKVDFDRYWYSAEIAEYRAKTSGLYQVPLLPAFWHSVGFGVVRDLAGVES